jgi:hypothetical protein
MGCWQPTLVTAKFVDGRKPGCSRGAPAVPRPARCCSRSGAVSQERWGCRTLTFVLSGHTGSEFKIGYRNTY